MITIVKRFATEEVYAGTVLISAVGVVGPALEWDAWLVGGICTAIAAVTGARYATKKPA